MQQEILKGKYNNMSFDFLIHENPRDTFIILPGFPAYNDIREEFLFLYNKGFNVFYPFYSGTYQSDGKFLDRNIIEELDEFVKKIDDEEFVSLWDMKTKRFKIKKKIIVAGSFSSPLALGLATRINFSHLILFSPIADFTKLQKKERIYATHLTNFARRAYKNVYRFNFKNILCKLSKIKEIRINYYCKNLKGIKILVFHNKKDKRVNINEIEKIKKACPNNIKVFYHNYNHLYPKLIVPLWSKIKNELGKSS